MSDFFTEQLFMSSVALHQVALIFGRKQLALGPRTSVELEILLAVR